MPRILPFIGAFLPVLLLIGCETHRVNPDPMPSRPVPAAYSVAPDIAALPSQSPWYEAFQQPALNALMANAFQDNLDIQQAVARLTQARAVAQAAGADRLPAIGATANASQGWEDGDGGYTAAQAGLSMSWDMDIFNRLSNTTKVRQAEAQAAVAELDAMHLAISAELAQSFFIAAAQQAQLKLLAQQDDADTRRLDLVTRRFQGGLGTKVDVLQQQSQLAATQSLMPPVKASLRVAENRLDVLVGVAPDGVDRVSPATGLPESVVLPPLGVPSDLLRSRPDLRVMQKNLVASDAQIAAAIADRLPRVTLTGTLLVTAGETAANTASLLGGLVQPLLDWGKRKAEVTRNKGLYQERLAAYTQLYLKAVEEVENALYQESQQREYVQRLEVQRALLAQTLMAAEAVYKAGDSDYLAVLNALTTLNDIDRTLITQRLNLVLARISVYRALGGPLPAMTGKTG